jgi:N-acetylglucosaminyldiphosphoundecaprenol N-acetyl-beta-D-mannosaminyltransferase
MKNKVNFLGIPVDAITMQETLNLIVGAIISKKQIHHTVINAGKVVSMLDDKELAKSVIEADLINADGQSIVWAANFLGISIPERVAGIDLMENLVELSFKNNYKCFFFGAKNKVVKEIVRKYSVLYCESIIAGFRNGFYQKKNERQIVDQIIQSNANILFVAITSPKKEIFLNKYKEELKNINLIMGVGGSFDVISGQVSRAPIIMRKYGLEWFFRFLQEPSRMWKRYFYGNSIFLFIVFREYFKIVMMKLKS